MKLDIRHGTSLYHGSVSNFILEATPTWFALDKETAMAYGNVVFEYKLNTDLKMINIQSLEFHNRYMDDLNQLFTGQDYNGVDDRKIYLCIPIGLPNYEVQSKLLREKGIVYEQKLFEYMKDSNKYEMYASCFNDRHRFSANSLDKEMVVVLKQLYPEYDGYASLIKWPSKIHGGLFNKEVCIFNPILKLEYVKTHHVRKGAGKQLGSGSNTCPLIVEGDTWNRMCEGISQKEINEILEKFKDIDWTSVGVIKNNLVKKGGKKKLSITKSNQKLNEYDMDFATHGDTWNRMKGISKQEWGKVLEKFKDIDWTSVGIIKNNPGK
jgi:hypothetical protein